MTLDDVKILIEDEKHGEMVVSSHTKPLWDKLKNHIKNNKDALRASKIMRINMHNVLLIFYEIHSSGYDNFLVDNFLHPEYANFSIEFIGFNPKDGSYREMIKTKGNKKQYENNAKRYIRKSLESLEKYKDVKNRNTIKISSNKIDVLLEELLILLDKNKTVQAMKKLNSIFIEFANIGYNNFKKK